jgi:hypothetical protein
MDSNALTLKQVRKDGASWKPWSLKLRPGCLFLRGPIPLDWLARAFAEGRAAIAVALHLWFLAGVHNSSTVRVNLSRLKVAPKMAPSSASDGLKRLEAAGLVHVARKPGSAALVTILGVEEWVLGVGE